MVAGLFDIAGGVAQRFSDMLNLPMFDLLPGGPDPEHGSGPAPRLTDYTGGGQTPRLTDYLTGTGFEDKPRFDAWGMAPTSAARQRGVAAGNAATNAFAPNNRPVGYSPTGATGTGATGADPGTDKWRDIIDQAAGEYGIDGDAIQAVMMIESGGNPNALSPAGAIGLMQTMPFHWGEGEDPWDPAQNIRKGAKILADNLRRYGSWDKAVAAYLGAIDGNGNITTAQDAHGTDGFKYVNMFNANLARIKGARQAQPTVARGAGAASSLGSLFGGQQFATTQGFGRTGFSTGEGSGIYDFGSEFGLDGDSHTGWDIGTPIGTNLYMPSGLSGTVTIAGGSGYYKDETLGNAPGTGEIRITLDNGMELILGHNSRINVAVGQRVSAGQLLGQTGWANGAHLHIELRQRDPSTRSRWRIVSPEVIFGALPPGHSANDGHNH